MKRKRGTLSGRGRRRRTKSNISAPPLPSENKSSSPSPSPLGRYYLPPELIAGILSRLSVKPLIRFTCVSKSWYSLIESPDFKSQHLKNYTLNDPIHHHYNYPYPRIIACDRSSAVIRKSDNFARTMKIKLDSGYYSFRGYVNGLLMLCCERDIVLLNPSIRRGIRLPNSPLLTTHSMSAGLAFVENDYKVVGIMTPCSLLVFRAMREGLAVDHKKVNRVYIEIYSVRDRSWKSIKVSPTYLPRYDNNTAFLNGTIHWIGYDKKMGDSMARYKDNRIIALDVATEMLNYIELPKYHRHGSLETSKVSVLGQCLALFTKFDNEASIWVMEEYGKVESWTRRYKIEDLSCSGFLYLGSDEMLLINGRGVHVYHVEDNNEMVRLGSRNLLHVHHANVYVESLVLYNETHGLPPCDLTVLEVRSRRKQC